MPSTRWPFWKHAPRRGKPRRGVRWRPARRLTLEWLESRILLSGDTLATAVPLTFTAFETAHAAGFLAGPDAVALYRVHLDQAGDRIQAAITAQTTGSALESVLRVFDTQGRQLALDKQEGGDPGLSFQAAQPGDYFLGVSAAGDDAYDPATAATGHGGRTTGLFALDLRRTPAAPLTADLAGSAFRLATATAAYGDTVAATFAVDNRGGADAGAFVVQVVLSPNNRFGPQSLVLTTFSLAGLGAGQAFSPGGFAVTLPDLTSATAAGFPVSGPVYLGLRIDPGGAVPELNPHDQGGVHRGADWEALTIVLPVTASGSNDSPASAEGLAGLDSRVSGTLSADESAWYQLTVPATGRLTAEVTATTGTLLPRLTLAGPDGRVLIESNDGVIVQHLQPGTYDLAVSGQSDAGPYQLLSEFVQANAPLNPVGVGTSLASVAVADVNGDGIPDIIIANKQDSTVSVLLGNGDGTFAPRQTFSVGNDNAPTSVAVADVNGDGIPDIITANSGDNTVSVLLGNGDGTFQPQQTFPVGTGPTSVAVADLNGDGRPDIITGNSGSGSVSVLPGNGDGTFQPQQTFPVGTGLTSVAVADVNGDGKPDLIVGNRAHTSYSGGYGGGLWV
jgi:hypothetical protein